MQCNNRELTLEPEIDAWPRHNRVKAAVIDKHLPQCVERIVPNRRDKVAATSRESVPPLANVVPKPTEERPIVDIGNSFVATGPP